MNKNHLKFTKQTFYEQGEEDSKSGRHVEDLCQEFWTSFVRYCDKKLFNFSDLVECYPHYRKGIVDSRKQ